VIFSFNGWSTALIDIRADMLECCNNMYECSFSAVVRVTVRGGTYHEDVGFGYCEHKKKGLAIEQAKKEAVTDGCKRALRWFGNKLGSSLQHDRNQREITKQKTTLAPQSSYASANEFNADTEKRDMLEYEAEILKDLQPPFYLSAHPPTSTAPLSTSLLTPSSPSSLSIQHSSLQNVIPSSEHIEKKQKLNV